VSGLRFAFDASKPAGHRIVSSSVTVGGNPLQPDQVYSLATKKYLAEGHDGGASSHIVHGSSWCCCELIVSSPCLVLLPPALHEAGHSSTVWCKLGTLPSLLSWFACAGYEALKGAPLLCDADCTPLLPTVLMNHFLLIRILNHLVGCG
jgi:hypothetical protein